MSFAGAVGLLLLFLSGQAIGRTMKERYQDADTCNQRYSAGCTWGQVSPQWIQGTSDFWYYIQTPRGGEFFLVEPELGTKKPLFDQELLAKELGRELKKEIKPYALPTLYIGLDKGRKSMSVTAEGQDFHYDLEKGALTRRSPEAAQAQGQGGGGNSSASSPDGRYEAFIRDSNLYLKEKTTNKEWRLSTNGSSGEPYSMPVQWSPDSSRLVCCRSTVVPQRKVRLLQAAPSDQLQPKDWEINYAKPGDALPITRPVVFTTEAESGADIVFEFPEKQYQVGDVRWAGNGKYFTFTYNKRGHGEYIVYRVDRDSVQARPAVRETSGTFVSHTRLFRHDIEDRDEIVWISERDGWRHLYLMDGRTGEVKRQVTRGEWVVKNVLKVDEKERTVRFVACGRDKGENPYLEKICRVSLDGGEVTCLTPENADHSVVFSPDEKYIVDCMARADMPPRSALRDTATGRIIADLAESDIAPAVKAGWTAPEVFCAKGRDGQTDIWGLIVLPPDFEKGKKYPVLEYIYAGPHDSHVPRRFHLDPEGARYAQLGFIVVMIDGMGTANRSKKFHDVCWKNLKDAGFPDRIAWMKAASQKHPELDLTRVGIYGMSAGGQNAMGAVLFHPEFYKAAVASCGCHDNRMDKIWWNEQWMGYPLGKEYSESSNVDNAWRLQGALMLICGEIDDNVDPATGGQVADALIKANKEFEYVLVPGARHTMGEKYGERKRRDFFIKHLMGEGQPHSNSDK